MNKIILILSLLCLTWWIGACQVLPGGSIPGGEVDGTVTQTPAGTTRVPELTPQGWAAGQDILKQWAKEAEASSVYVDPEWGADQATGAPDAPGCGDYQFAWASAASDEVATLELTYGTPVYVSAITIIQSFNPNQVVKVEILDPEGEFTVVYQAAPVVVDRPCPFALSVPVEKLDFKSNRVRITVDQSVLGLGWNEIDAVRLAGVVEEQ
ncbi:MAG: hypothetical protein MAG431_02055 [Chloroflexi bacterium]|nr:hypothetical protein [Chloroflexota bacterium]